MSNETQGSRNQGDSSRRRRSRGGSNRNRNNQNHNRNGGGDRGPRESRESRGGDRGQSRAPKDGARAEEFRPQAPRRTYAPPKKTFWQKLLSIVGLYKEPTPPSRYDRKPEPAKQSAAPQEARPPKSNTRNARSNEGDARPPREKRPEGERQPKERAPRNNDRPKGGDPKSVGSSRVYVGNLSYDVTEQDLQELFKGVGGVRNVEIVYNRSTHRSKGYGFVEMLRMDEAIRSVEVLHDQHFMGRKLTVSGAKSKGQDERDDNEPVSEPTKVVLAPLAPVAAVAATTAEEPSPEAAAAPVDAVIETIVETAPQEAPAIAAAEEVAAPAAPAPQEAPVDDLVSKYSFDEPKKTEEA